MRFALFEAAALLGIAAFAVSGPSGSVASMLTKQPLLNTASLPLTASLIL